MSLTKEVGNQISCYNNTLSFIVYQVIVSCASSCDNIAVNSIAKFVVHFQFMSDAVLDTYFVLVLSIFLHDLVTLTFVND